jgi:putative hemolysin
MNKILIPLLLILPMTACNSMKENQFASTKLAIANPASEYCIAQGGKLIIKNEKNGQVGYCNLPNGDEIEEWEYYRDNYSLCIAEKAATLIGQKGLTEQQIQQISQAKVVRSVTSGQAVTMDYREDRVTITLDPVNHTIIHANCG